jgi:hypothetical protein
MIKNTDSPYCVGELIDPPVATIAMEDVEDAQFTVKNLNLGECLLGDLYADVEMIRGIKSPQGTFTHLRREKIYDVWLGTIKCDDSCLSCSGTSATECLICADQTQFIYDGECLSTCPAEAPAYTVETTDFQSQRYYKNFCQPECPSGTFANEETNECMECNPDCQTCDSSLMASCTSCNPIKYLFNGICLTNCPTQHHSNNYANYTCDEISTVSGLYVQIQSLGYKSRIPKDYQVYLKVNIVADEDDAISSILWTQIEPEIVAPGDDHSIFMETDTVGVYYDYESVIPVKASSFNFMGSKQAVKV